jgi:glucan biosynthesis protein C
MKIGGWAAAAIILVIALPVLIVTVGSAGPEPFLGGLTWQSAAYAFWEAATGTSLFIVTLVFFARRGGGKRGPFLRYSEASFGVYQFHAPIIVLAAALMQQIAIHPGLRYLVLAIIGALVPWALTELVRLVRPLRKFL